MARSVRLLLHTLVRGAREQTGWARGRPPPPLAEVPPTCRGYFASGQRPSANSRGDTGLVDILGSQTARRADREQVPRGLTGEDVKQKPWTYHLTPVPPDEAAARLSDAAKEQMWQQHEAAPSVWTVARLAREYRVREQRVHAILWLKGDEKVQEKARGVPLDKNIEKEFERVYGAFPKGAGERHWRHDFERREGESEEDAMRRLRDESDREEVMKLDEFVTRFTFNTKQMAGEVKSSKMERRRPPEGWSYLVEELGSAGVRGKGGGTKSVALPDGTRRRLTELEKDFLRRETRRPRRRTVPG